MLLKPEQTARFYRVWFSLLKFVNAKTGLIPDLYENPATGSLEIKDAVKLRNALWESEELLDQFITENPARLGPADLDLAASWHNRIAGNFFIFRHLKNYSLFFSEKAPNHVFGVLGLYSPLKDITGSILPVYVKTVLLPFEGSIITDGLIEGYNVSFGPGIRANLKDAYRDAQEREGIITSLEPAKANLGPEELRREINGRNTKLLKAFEKELAASNLSLKMISQHSENVERFGREYLLTQEPPRQLLDLTLPDVQAFLALPDKVSSRVSLRRFVRFLYNTGRLESEKASDLNAYFKSLGAT
jgi:hypothetical protein